MSGDTPDPARLAPVCAECIEVAHDEMGTAMSTRDTNTGDPAEVTADDERWGEIDQQREVLASGLEAAGVALRSAELALGRLTDLYDVEFAEGHAGEDVAAHIEAARRSVRAAEAITTITTSEARHA